MKLALLAIGLLGLGIAGMAIKMFFGKGYLEKSCASASRLFDEDSDGSCKFCGASSDEKCKSDEMEELPNDLPSVN